MFPWLHRGVAAGASGGGSRQVAARLRSLEAEAQRLDVEIGRTEAQFQRLLSRPPAHLEKYEVIRWREERRRERDTTVADLRDRQAQLRGEIGAARQQLSPDNSAAAD
jgi:hypothetical protein